MALMRLPRILCGSEADVASCFYDILSFPVESVSELTWYLRAWPIHRMVYLESHKKIHTNHQSPVRRPICIGSVVGSAAGGMQSWNDEGFG